MAECPPLILRLLAHSVTAARKAGEIIRDIMKKGELGIVNKGKDDLQTEADRSAQTCIFASLLDKFPGLTIIGEEGQLPSKVPSDWIDPNPCKDVLSSKYLSSVQSSDLKGIKLEDIVVWVDPLDGTSEYTQGLLSHVTVLIGLAVNGKAIGGVIHQPYFEQKDDSLGRSIWGLKGMGIGGFQLSPPIANRFHITTTRSHSNEIVESTLLSLNPDAILRVGGAGYKVILLLEGKAHAYVFASPGCKKWDTCAPEGVLSSCGGILTDIYGSTYSYTKDVEFPNSKGVLAALMPEFHQKCVIAIKGNGVKL